MQNQKKKRAILIGAGILILTASLYNGLMVTTYKIKSEVMNTQTQLRIVLLTDLHNHIYMPKQKPLIDKIKALKPDLILLAGDIADDRAPILGTELLLEGIENLAPIYYVTGNHEWWSNDIESIFKVLDRYNINILQGESATINIKGQQINIMGVDDPSMVSYNSEKASPEEEFKQLEKEKRNDDVYNVLLVHRPEQIKALQNKGYDLVVSGHAHGGQVRIPFLIKGLFSPNQGFFPKYTSGVTYYGTTAHVISRGLSFNWRLPRVFNPPEIVLIEVTGE